MHVARPRPGLDRHWKALPRLLRFFIVGGVNALFGYGAYATLLFVGLHFAAAALLGTIAGVLFNYVTTGRFVFGRDRSHGRLVRFVSVYVVLYGLNVAALTLLQQVVIGSYRVDVYVAGLVLIVPMALVSYVLLRRFVFEGGHAAR